jgi:Flp pilus assembly protein TadG
MIDLFGRKSAGRGRRPGRRAAAAVEFAVVAVVFFPLVFGVFEIGRGLMVEHTLGLAALRGCRTAVVEGNSDTDVSAAVQTVMTEVGLTHQTVTVKVNNVTANCNTANAGDEVTVVVSVPVNQVTWVPGGSFLSGNISAQYTLLRE